MSNRSRSPKRENTCRRSCAMRTYTVNFTAPRKVSLAQRGGLPNFKPFTAKSGGKSPRKPHGARLLVLASAHSPEAPPRIKVAAPGISRNGTLERSIGTKALEVATFAVVVRSPPQLSPTTSCDYPARSCSGVFVKRISKTRRQAPITIALSATLKAGH